MKQTSFYIKAVILLTLIFAQAVYLVMAILEYVNNQLYLSTELGLPIAIVISMSLIVVTMSLSAGAWEDKIWRWIFCLPIPFAIALGLVEFGAEYSISGFMFALLLLGVELWQSIKYKRLMLKFVPNMIVKNLTRGILLIFSVFAAFLVYFDQETLQNINFGKRIAEYAAEPVQRIVDQQINQQMETQMEMYDLNTLNEQNPMIGQLLGSFGITDLDSIDTKELLMANSIGLDIESLIEGQINNFIAPYRQFIGPVTALLVLSVFYFFGSTAYYLYALLVGGVFYIARKTHLLNTEKVMVEQEVLKF